MFVVLVERVLKLELPLEHYLSPQGRFGIRKDPALVVFGLDNEHPEAGDQNVVNLGGSVLDIKSDVVEQMVRRRRKTISKRPGNYRFALLLQAMHSETANKEASEKRGENDD